MAKNRNSGDRIDRLSPLGPGSDPGHGSISGEIIRDGDRKFIPF